VADDENAFCAVVARQGSKETLYSERDIRAALTARGAVPVFAFPFATLMLLWKSCFDALVGESVEDSKFDLTEAFFHDKSRRIAKCGCDFFSRLQGAVVRRRKDDVELVAACKITARLAGLLMAKLRERGLQITEAEVEGVLSGSLGNAFFDVSRGFPVAEDD